MDCRYEYDSPLILVSLTNLNKVEYRASRSRFLWHHYTLIGPWGGGIVYSRKPGDRIFIVNIVDSTTTHLWLVISILVIPISASPYSTLPTTPFHLWEYTCGSLWIKKRYFVLTCQSQRWEIPRWTLHQSMSMKSRI